jgi:FkbM family methyltransferase
MGAGWSKRWRTVRGVVRSLRTYYGGRGRRVAMASFYGRFVTEGDLVFDVGAHVGDRVGAFRRLGARVVAIEPQPALVRMLKLLYGHDPSVAIEAVAVGRNSGSIELKLNLDNPTVSTASRDFIDAAKSAPGWERQAWTAAISVPLATLDAMIARYGNPAFIKIDVEGFEAEALAGLTRPPPALSFEFTTIQRDVATAAIARCAALGLERFNAVLGESLAFVHSDWLDTGAIATWLDGLPQAANSGDIYAMAA